MGAGRMIGLAMAQKFFNFSALRRGKGTAKASAFQGRRRGSEPQRAWHVLVFGDGERKRAMEHVAGAQRVHGVHRKGRRLLQGAALVEPDGALRAPRPRQE